MAPEADEKPGANPVPNSPLPWTGDYVDGLGNPIRMLAYANPPDIKDEKGRADGYGLVRIDKAKRQVTFECWPRFAGAAGMFPGWPVTVGVDANDGRAPLGHLPELVIEGAANPVVQVVAEATGEVVSSVRVTGNRVRPAVFAPGTYTVKVGRDRPDGATLTGLVAGGGTRRVAL